MRAGLMMHGRVLMAPSRVDATSHNGDAYAWLQRLRVYVDGIWAQHCVAYDEDEGTCLVANTMLRPHLIRGRVRAVPRAA